MIEANSSMKPLVLIVDDDRFMRVKFVEALETAEILTATAADGLDALTKFTELQPDLVLLDLNMPRCDGFDACRAIRTLPEGRHTPVLVVTGQVGDGLVHRAFEAGATDFVSKSIEPELLLYRVRCLLRNNRLLKKLQESEDRLERTQQIARLGDWEWRPEDESFWQSPEMSRILGMPLHASTSFEGLLGAVSPADREMVRENLVWAQGSSSGCDFECRIVRSDGSERLVWIYARQECADHARPARLIGTLQDVTEIRQVEDRNKMLKEAVDSLQIGITFSDVDGRIVYANPAEARMQGYQVEDLIGRHLRDFNSEPRQVQLPNPDEDRVLRREGVKVRRSGEEFPVRLTSIPIRDLHERYLGIVTTCEDVSEQKQAEKKINRLAYFDSLTDLPNRAMFLEQLNHSLALAARSGETVGLMFLDLDKFKGINDTLGHVMGDKLLCEVARRLAHCTRESDVLARLGGDEFVVLLNVVASQAGVASAAQRMLDALAAPFQIDGRTVYTSASIGIAFYPDDCHDASSLFCCADTAMYHAKKEGRGQFRLCSAEINREIMHRMALEHNLRCGLERREFFLQYQPQWDLKTGRLVGVEALLRWQSAELGLMYPSAFVSLIEESDLIFSIGAWVLKTACEQARQWAEEGHAELRVAVNVSGKQFKQFEFVDTLSAILRDTGLNPRNLDLEFTETVIMENVEMTREKLAQLKLIGVQLSIDAFGTGYSSLNYLKHFEVDRIKIDSSFVADVPHSDGDAAIVEAIVNMAQIMKFKVLAEGVENIDQLHFLAELGCDEVQGFYLAKPMTADALSESMGDLQISGGWPLGLDRRGQEFGLEVPARGAGRVRAVR
jgi:diguanylate cyclase (GGDEF)-like protein/PAS domain S-box-containing protein